MDQVMLLPYLTRGHIIPLLHLCDKLSTRSRQKKLTTVYTIVISEKFLEFVSAWRGDNVRFVTIPNPNPAPPFDPNHLDYVPFYQSLETTFERLLDSTDLPVKFIIVDVMMLSGFDPAYNRKIPVAAYWPMTASMFILLYHARLMEERRANYQNYASGRVSTGNRPNTITRSLMPSLRKLRTSTSDTQSDHNFRTGKVDYIPGLSPISLADLPWPPHHIFHNVVKLLHVCLSKSNCLLLTTLYELETDAINEILAVLPIPVYLVGLNIPDLPLQPNLPSNEPSCEYLSWLNSKPQKSVLYVSLGYLPEVSGAQIAEMLAGLKLSGVNFLWATPGVHLKGDFGSNGLAVEWCDQWKVLSHSSVGGFLSHCGWNSTKQSLLLGVPMLTFPIAGDQLLNRKLIIEDWKNGRNLKNGSFVRKEAIAVVVRRFMNLESELMINAKHLEGICLESVEEGRRADKEIDCFIRESEKNWVQDFI
ncbi:UDP-glucuronosyl/UDP-glucosyltransferase [Artemisia annua]|uniref:Glycosyltransferase n=1 Tax=Artemisia annua TaxID=35608 RepID=A0A2U1LHD5_ARTAN|nr:UDP-glucuronosyl/UDP-glucosyltransferase [Artemisia annua]